MITNIYNKIKGFGVFSLLFPLSSLLLTTSCSDMLQTSSELVEFEKDNTLNHTTDSVYSVMGIVNKLQLIADRTVILGETRADLVTATGAASADLKRLSAFDFSQDNKYNEVSDYYAIINNCNYYLAHIDTAMQRRGRNLFINEFAVVKAYRAWTYLQLAINYGNVPLVTTPLMTEVEARDAMNGPRVGIADICDYFIADLTPFVGVELPVYTTHNGMNPQQFFLPMRVVLGDLCLWSGRYEEAARWYHDYLTDEKKPVTLRTSRSTWPSATELVNPTRSYSVDNNNEVLCYIPMEERVFDGVVSDLPNIYNSTNQNYRYFQLQPSMAMRNLSAAQTYCFEVKYDTKTDTLFARKTGLMNDLYAGDLRLCSNYTLTYQGKDEYSEYNSERQTIKKLWDNLVPVYRRSMVYLRYAEALNRAGLPQSAMVILKYGVCKDYFEEYVDSTEFAKAGSLIDFDQNIFPYRDAMGIHSFGSGDSQANPYYVLPMPADSLATYADTVAYQIPLVEDMIIDEMALEGAFEGNRFYDLLRVALRRGDPAYLADPISRRQGEVDERLRSLLMNPQNWYLPLP